MLIEFVSANPTGPLTAASGRHAAYGDALARLLEFAGHEVDARVLLQRRRRAGAQARRVDPGARARRGAARGRLPGRLRGRAGGRARRAPPSATPRTSRPPAAQLMIERIKATLERFRVDFDRWFSERSLHEGERRSIARARAGAADGHVYESEGALWLRTTDVRRRQGPRARASDGAPTYFAADIAYHEDKLERGFDRLITSLGADHHGYVARMKAALAALGARPGPARDPAAAVRPPGRARRARLDVQAPRRLRHARRPDRRDRRRRHALLHAPALARHDDRPRPRPRARGVEREPRLLRPVRARADRLGAAQGGRRAGRRGARRRRRARAPPGRARADQEAARVPGRGRRRRRTAARRTGSPPTRSSWRRPSRPSTATARSSAPSREAVESFRLGAVAWRRSARSPARSTCSGV